MRMKIKVVGSKHIGRLIKGPVKIGKEIVITHNGKVEIGIVIRTKALTATNVRFGETAVVLKNNINRRGLGGPIAKGLSGIVKAKSSMTF